MKKVVSMSLDNERLEAASRWVLMLDEGMDEEEQKALRAWLAEDPRNPDELLEVAEVWDKTSDLSRLARLFPREHKNKRFWLHQNMAALAASVVVTIAIGLFWNALNFGFDGPGEVITEQSAQYFVQYETAIGEQANVSLLDGSLLSLNTNSRLTVAYSKNARVLKLHRGEIHIDVAEDPSRPFSVVAGDRVLQALGTSFSVEITQDDQIELVVTEGKVVVGVNPVDSLEPESEAESTSAVVTPTKLKPSGGNVVSAGEELIFGARKEKAATVSQEEIEVKLSWREGSLVFRGEPLESALAEVERYTTIQFVLLDKELKTTTVSGRFKAGDVETLLASLKLNFNIVHERDGEGRVLLSSD